MLTADLAGRIRGGEHGLWVMETRMLSRHEWLIDGRPPQPAGASAIDSHTWDGYAIAGCSDGDTKPAEHAIELHVRRDVGDGMLETVEIVNHRQERAIIELRLLAAADFAAPQEVRKGRRQHGQLTREWRADGTHPELRFTYGAEHASPHAPSPARIRRVLVIRVEQSDSPALLDPEGLGFRVTLEPHGTWWGRLAYVATMEGRELPFLGRECVGPAVPLRLDVPSAGHLTRLAAAAFERALGDLAALRLRDLDLPSGAATVSGGLPSYVAFFGRDALVVGLQASLAGPELLLGALEHLARTQADCFDDWRDAQPGRMVHELHTDPLAALLIEPHGSYYGDVPASVLYPVALWGHWRCTGDLEALRRYVEPAMRAMAWADACSLNADGFYRYETRSSQGEKNQGWKDSSEAIVWPDGRLVQDPLGTCEMQSNVYCAKRCLGAVLRALGRREEAGHLFRDARALKLRFLREFWMEDESWIGQAIDARGTLVRSVASDGADCLVSGILDGPRAERLVRRLFAPDLFSGWGVRTLSSRHPAYNPFSYHRGSVWPVENAAIMTGLARGGFVTEMLGLCRAQLEAAALFDEVRLPEVFAGHSRDEEHPFPGLYPRADWPQAWSASAVVAMIQAMLGIVLDAPRKRLVVDPHLPEWLPVLTVRGIRVGGATVSLRFAREPSGATAWSIEDLTGAVRVVAR